MSFFYSLKRAFGFGGDEEFSYEDEAPSALVTPYRKKPDTAEPANVTARDEPSGNAVQESDAAAPEFPLTFFDGILEVFNNAQPDFIKKCLDHEAQRHYLYDTLGTSFKEYLSSCRSEIERSLSARSHDETKRYRDEITGLRERCKSMEEKEEELNQQRLSADRQKRALNNRVQDLERQVMTLESEKEQYILENKSLLNKIKVSDVLEADAGVAREETDALRQRLEVAEKSSEKLQAEVERLNTEVLENAELYKTKMSMSDKMLSDIRNNASQVKKELDDSRNELAELQHRYDESLAAMASMQSELDEANATLATVDEVQRQVERFDEVLGKRDEKIRALKATREEQSIRIKSLENEIAAIRDNFEKALEEHAAVRSNLERTVEELKAAETVKIAEEKPRRRKKSVPKISAIDDTLDSTEWLVSTPPAGMVAKTTGAVSDADFGYQEPPRRSAPDNAAQMSLF